VTIVVGLLFASALTLFVVPVLYATFFKARPEKESISQYAEADAPSRA
jgi:Cu/Ag efflux pump CusA